MPQIIIFGPGSSFFSDLSDDFFQARFLMGFWCLRTRKVIILGGARCGFYIVNNRSERMSAHFGPERSPDRRGEGPVLRFGFILETFGALGGTLGPFWPPCAQRFPLRFSRPLWKNEFGCRLVSQGGASEGSAAWFIPC